VKPTWVRVRNMIADIKGDFPQGVIGPGFNDRFGDVFGNIYAFTSDGLTQRQLRDRVEDIPILVRYYVEEYARRMNRKIKGVPAAAMEAFSRYCWPGNVRELQNFIERAVILTRGRILEAPLSELRLPRTGRSAFDPPPTSQADLAEIVKGTLHALEGKKNARNERTKRQREEIIRALTESNGRVGGTDGAAARMGVSRTTLIYRMKGLRIEPDDYRSAELQFGR